jgi:prepilin-type N-terminal cleavage/methylation domain-containing protein
MGRTTGRIRAGFTLMELMIVLALLVIMGAIVGPALYRPFENYKLSKGGDQVRTLFSKAQMRAIRSGQIQVLVFIPGSNQVQIQALSSDQDLIEAASQMGIGTGQSSAVASSNMSSLGPLVEMLPEGVMFAQAVTTGDIRDQLAQQNNAVSGMSNGMQGNDLLSQGGVPLMFYPDGTSTTARVVVTNQLNNFIVMDLRGLTGIATVSELLTAEELSAF